MSRSSSNLPPEARIMIASLRALVISQKFPCRIGDLLREYRQLEGAGMNWSKYGFRSVDEFLVASGEFDLQKLRGDTFVTAKPSSNTEHIVRMVQKQKSGKVKRQLRQPYISDQSWNKSSFSSNVYPRLISETPKKIYHKKYDMKPTNGDSNNNHVRRPNGQMLSPPAPVIQNKNSIERPMQQAVPTATATTKPVSFDLRERLRAKREQAQTNANDLRDLLNSKRELNTTTALLAQSHSASRAILKQDDKKSFPVAFSLQQRLQNSQNGLVHGNSLVVQLQQQQQTAKSPTQPTAPAIIDSTNASTPVSDLVNKRNVNNRLPGIATESGKISIQDRLKIKQSTNLSSEELLSAIANEKLISNSITAHSIKDSSSSELSNHSVIKTAKQNGNMKNTVAVKKPQPKENAPKKPEVFHFNPNMDPVTTLAQYCQFRDFSGPEYKLIRTKFSPRIQARVLVNGVMYSTYPDDFGTEHEAGIACATIAVNQIKIDEARNLYPICTDSDVDLAMKLYQELCNHPHGIFCKNIPEFFQSTFKQKLPDHWFSVLQGSRQFIMETIADDNVIVLANVDTSDTSSTSSISDSEFVVLDRINLPWSQKYWNLYITHCVSTTEIWARIVGKEYSDQLDSILNDVDLSMLTNKTRPPSIICGQIYLVSMTGCWHRVRVENMNKSDGTCLCFFIDFGDDEWVSMDQLFVCESQFLRLPPQAIPLSLYGLEDFAENPNAKIHLDAMLIGKTLVAEIITKKETFELLNDSDVDINARLQVALYDTSSNEDVNLNPKLLTRICDDTPPPELKRTGATNVMITHVNNDGEIFVQVKSIGLVYIQKLINQLVESKFQEEEHQVVLADLKKSDSLFLVQDVDDSKWYRGALVWPEDNPVAQANQYNMLYVDYGQTKITNISRIFRLESLSAALSKFPRQSLKVKLHNLPPIGKTIVARIRGLLPPECPAIVKLAVHAVVPQVTIYRRFDSNEGLFNVNEVIRIEYELETTSDQNDSQTTTGSPDESRCNSSASNHGMKSPITVPASPQKGELQKLSEPTSIPPIGEDFNVFVSMASNPSNFVVQPYSEGPKLSELMKSLQEYCLNNEEFIPGDMVEIGQAYAAQNADGIYHRVTVENIFNNASMIQFLVFYCDFGDFAVLGSDKLKTLPAKFRTLPKQAIMAKLYGIKPKHCDWTVNDCMRFRELTVGQRFASIVRQISDDVVCTDSKIVELELIDVQTAEDVFVHDILIEEDRAIADKLKE